MICVCICMYVYIYIYIYIHSLHGHTSIRYSRSCGPWKRSTKVRVRALASSHVDAFRTGDETPQAASHAYPPPMGVCLLSDSADAISRFGRGELTLRPVALLLARRLKRQHDAALSSGRSVSCFGSR